MNMVTMIIIWAVVVAAAFMAEFLYVHLVSAWFAVGGIAALISAAFDLFWPWQILLFAVVSLAFLLGLRPFASKLLKTKTIPTNADEHIGKKYKLLKDVVEGRSEIKIHDIIWTVVCDTELKQGASVEVTEISGNKYIVKEST